MTERENEERRAWWALQSEKRALAKRIKERTVSPAQRAAVEEQIRYAEELYEQGLAEMMKTRV